MRTKKAIKNALYSAIFQVCSVVCGLITPRLILSAFGSSYNGVIASANQFLEMISFLTLGIAGATRVALYKPIANGDIYAISRIIKSNKIYMRKVGIAVLFYAAILCVIYPLISHNNLPYIESAMLIVIVSIGAFAQYFFSISNQTLLSADQSVYVYYIVQTISIITNTIIAAIIIHMGGSIFDVKLGSAIVFLIAPITLNYIVKKKYNLIDDCSPDDIAIKNRGAVAFHSIANIIHEDTDLMVLTLFVDAKLISVYSIHQLIVGKVRQMLMMLTFGLEAAFGNMWAKGEKESFISNFRFFEFLVFAATSIIFCCVSYLIVPFISLYTKDITDINYIRPDFAMIAVITEAIYCIRQPYIVVVQSTGNYEGTKMGALYEALINILLSILLVNFWGLNGVMFGTLVANLFRTIQYAFYISNHIIQGSIIGSIIRIIWFISNSMLVVFLQHYIINFIPKVDGWGGWIINGVEVIIIAVFITAITAFFFYSKEMKKLAVMLHLHKHE